jgi:hypothetical protein
MEGLRWRDYSLMASQPSDSSPTNEHECEQDEVLEERPSTVIVVWEGSCISHETVPGSGDDEEDGGGA